MELCNLGQVTHLGEENSEINPVNVILKVILSRILLELSDWVNINLDVRMVSLF